MASSHAPNSHRAPRHRRRTRSRAEPSSDSEILAFLENGSVVVILESLESGDEGDWQQVLAGDQTGWVLASLLGQTAGG